MRGYVSAGIGRVAEGMMNRFFPRRRAVLKEALRRIDRVSGDLNVLLVVVAIGLATLDFTFLLTQKVIDHLPQVTRVTYESVASGPN
jgi:hypothetical protein